MSIAADAGAAPRPRRRLVELPVPVLCAGAAAVVVFGAAGLALGADGPTATPVAISAVYAGAFTPLAVFVLRRLPHHPLGRLMGLSGALASLATLAVCWSDWLPAAWVSQWCWWPPLACVPALLLIVPDGRLPSRRWRPLGWALVAGAVAATLSLAAAATRLPRTLLSGEIIGDARLRPVLLVALGGIGVVLVATLGVLVALAVRWHRAGPRERGQLACLAPAAVALAAGLALDTVFGTPAAWFVAVAALPLGLTLAVLRHQLHDLDLYVHRGVVWAVLTALAIGTYAVAVTALGAAADAGSPVPSVLAAAAVAALLQPAQRLVQRAVNRLLYGRRDEPYAVLTRLGRHLESLRDPLAVLPQITAGIVEGLRVPYAAVRMTGDDGAPVTAAEHGRWSGEPQRFAMVAHGQPVGELWIAPRRPGTSFSGAESRLLQDLAGQTALAAEAVRSSVRLQKARDRLVLAREEERRRLRRELHDGVASALVGTRMLAEAVRRTVPEDGSAPTLLAALSGDIDRAVAEVRALIDGLRPAALDKGLESALTALVDGTRGAAVTLTVDGGTDDLPAAVEVATYRIVAECLANVTKHAAAGSCTVTVRRDPTELEITVDDDGVGMAPGAGSGTGVGLSSIAERADELGGRATVTSDATGTRVRVRLPLAVELPTAESSLGEDPAPAPPAGTGPASGRSAS